jgi:hypothetical protein
MAAESRHGPLTEAEVRELDSTLLPALERHHLRLLAHGLRSLQEVAARRDGPLPDAQALSQWALSQPQVAGSPEFAQAFVAQLQSLGRQLRAIAAAQGCAPLGLSLDQLVQWARRQADQRLDASAEGPEGNPSAHQQPHPAQPQ